MLSKEDTSASPSVPPDSSQQDSASDNQSHLWTSLRNGSADALEQLFRIQYQMLFDYGVKLGFDEEIVKDTIQDVFAYLWEKRDRVSNVQSVKAYLLISLRRQLLKMSKKNARRRTVHNQFHQELQHEAFSAQELAFVAEMAAARREVFKATFDKIPVRVREALYLKTYEGMSHKEIAKIMDISPQVARNYVSKAFKILRESLS